MAIVYEDVTPSIIPNATMQKIIYNGTHRSYRVTPIAGYVMHDQARDWTNIDPITGEETYKLGYTTGTATCGYNYDFATSIVTDENGVEHTAYGSRQFFAVPETDVPADQIFGVGNNDHEAM